MGGPDYIELYRRARAAVPSRSKTPEEWGRRAERMNEGNLLDNSYTRDFLSAVDISGCESVLDVGCGVGNLLIPLCGRLKRGYGLDFSPGMLEAARANAKKAGLENATIVLRSWEDDWSDIPPADIVIASRCLDVDDMAWALQKLHAHAQRRIYVTYRIGPSYLDEAIYEAIGRKLIPRPDHMLVVNILKQLGMKPKLSTIRTEDKHSAYPDFEAFRKRVEWSLDTLSSDETRKLRDFFENLPRGTDDERVHKHPIEWALISWEK